MKRLILMLVLSTLILGACSPADVTEVLDSPDSTVSDTEGESDTAPDTTQAAEPFGLTYNDVRLVPGVHMDVESVLGAPVEKAEAPSCLHDGSDTVYYYEEVEIVTSPSAQGEYIVSVTVHSPDVKTEEGIAIGGNIADAIAALGDAEEAFGRYLFTRGNTTLTMMTEDDGTVISISYALAE